MRAHGIRSEGTSVSGQKERKLEFFSIVMKVRGD